MFPPYYFPALINACKEVRIAPSCHFKYFFLINSYRIHNNQLIEVLC